MDLASLGLGGGESDELIPPRAHKEPPEFDITAMVDLVFMMNIYFIVAFVTMALSEIDLPSASHVAPLDPASATVITLVGGGTEPLVVYLGDKESGEAVHGLDEQESRVRAAVEQGVAEGKAEVLIKGEKKLPLSELYRISTAATSVEGVKLNVAVREVEAP
jgi:biopolymer transport protein ExbD